MFACDNEGDFNMKHNKEVGTGSKTIPTAIPSEARSGSLSAKDLKPVSCVIMRILLYLLRLSKRMLIGLRILYIGILLVKVLLFWSLNTMYIILGRNMVLLRL